jgi:hypothetical protein
MDLEAYVDVQCALLGVQLTAEQRPGVVRYLQLAAAMAPRVMDFAAASLTPADESGNTFTPVAAAAHTHVGAGANPSARTPAGAGGQASER